MTTPTDPKPEQGKELPRALHQAQAANASLGRHIQNLQNALRDGIKLMPLERMGEWKTVTNDLLHKMDVFDRQVDKFDALPKPEQDAVLKWRKPEDIIIGDADLALHLGSCELLPCPFCGQRAMSSGERIAERAGKAIRWTIQCTGSQGIIPNCFASVIDVDPDEPKARATAVARWNRRALAGVPDPEAALKMAREALDLALVEVDLLESVVRLREKLDGETTSYRVKSVATCKTAIQKALAALSPKS